MLTDVSMPGGCSNFVRRVIQLLNITEENWIGKSV